MQRGKANLSYVPFHETKAWCNDTEDEACNLALDYSYPPPHARSARVGPEWLKYREWRKVIEMRSRGKNILEIAAAVDKNASLLRVYVDTYLRDSSTYDVGPLPSASSTDSQSTADTSAGSDELFPLGGEITVPREGAPDPSFLTRNEQELVWMMFQQNETVRSMWEQLKKSRRKISQYINAYMRPRLLQLQREEREAEYRLAGTSTYVTPLTIRSPRIRIPDTVPVATAARTPPRIFRDEGLHSIKEEDVDLKLIDTLPLNPTLNAPYQDTESSSGSHPLATPNSTEAEDSLFGDSPVDDNQAGSPLTRLATTHREEGLAQPASNKRKHHDDDSVEELQRASKRLRHRSFP